MVLRRCDFERQDGRGAQVNRHCIVFLGKVSKGKSTYAVASRFECTVHVDITCNVTRSADGTTHKDGIGSSGRICGTGQPLGFGFLYIIVDKHFTAKNLYTTGNDVVVTGKRVGSGTFLDKAYNRSVGTKGGNLSGQESVGIGISHNVIRSRCIARLYIAVNARTRFCL